MSEKTGCFQHQSADSKAVDEASVQKVMPDLVVLFPGAILNLCGCALLQRIQYAKSKSDAVSKADGTFVSKEKRKKQDEKGTDIIEGINRPVLS